MEHRTGKLTASAALEALAAAIPAGDYATALTTGPRRTPSLAVVSRDDPCWDVEVSAEGGWYWWPWGERIRPVGQRHAAALAVTRLLHPAPAPVAVHVVSAAGPGGGPGRVRQERS